MTVPAKQHNLLRTEKGADSEGPSVGRLNKTTKVESSFANQRPVGSVISTSPTRKMRQDKRDNDRRIKLIEDSALDCMITEIEDRLESKPKEGLDKRLGLFYKQESTWKNTM